MPAVPPFAKRMPQFPNVPAHPDTSPCAGCHAQQFSSSDSPICTICHTNVKSGALKSFPRLQSFRMKFDHSRHLSMGSVSCATCHRPSRGGVALSIPSGFNAHTTCYRCHSPRAQSGGRDISSCGRVISWAVIPGHLNLPGLSGSVSITRSIKKLPATNVIRFEPGCRSAGRLLRLSRSTITRPVAGKVADVP